MSWVKKKEQNSGPPPQVQMYNPNQHSNQEWQQTDNYFNQGGTQWQSYQQQPYNQNTPQYQFYQNTSYQQQPYANLQYNQQYTQNAGAQPQDEWGANWGWGDEDNNVQAPSTLTDSFTNDDTWNWGSEDPKEAPKKNKLDTPQWSVESQHSQESSDDILQTSESDKSRMLSRSSTISHSPISGQEPPVENKENLDVGAPQRKFRASTAFGVNLETLPDNSEQPDAPPPQPPRKVSPPWPENNEAPINDRNQYLETAQLSDVDFNRTTESVTQDNDTLPPPGLHRMVPGETIEPPEGLRRMIPGESSSPETSLRPQNPEPEPRSATIGADTPPTDRSATIGADTSPEPKRRESVEGDVAGLVTGVRSLTVGEKDENSEGSARKESESERENRRESPRRERGRYTPEEYRDRKYDRRRYRDRRYEEETDFSDKERRHRDEREYDRKYSSLRKEKDRRRKDDRRDYRRNEYYRYEDEFENESRSRASSRSDSVHDSYRERGHDRRDRRHREKERHRRQHRDPFNPYMPSGFGYDIYSQYYQQYHYYENLRKTNPQAYAQLYRKYYQDASGEASFAGGGEDRASVHSGRSSANDELTKDRYTRQSYYSQTSLPHFGGYYRGSQTHSLSGQYGLDDSSFVRTLDQTDASLNYEDPHLNPQRLTPAKFATAHIKASISSGKLVKILPHYPLDGQVASVELCNLETLLCNDEDYQELKHFPGPLSKGTTHKKTIIEYCESKIKEAHSVDIGDKDSYILMWELLILLIRQNGMVVGADIAELLLKNRENQRPDSVQSSVGSNAVEETNEASSLNTNIKEEEVTNRFREYLLYGSDKEALEWAMKHGLWGHALFLASKLDKRTYANVMMRFANGLTMNDPLQTLYQLLSGRTPAAVTCVADEKWGDWRPHLAMILSNSTQRPELNCKAITILGDTLMGRGSLFAAQFCYLMAEVGFGQYGNAEAKLVLLGSNHYQSFAQFATNEAIHMTEIYEYARSLNDADFSLANFQQYKYLLATRLADVGLLETSLAYLEKIASFILMNPSLVEQTLINDVSKLADRLKFYDPVGDGGVEVDFDSSRVENSWLKDLRVLQGDYHQPQAQYQSEDIWQAQQQQQYESYQQPQWPEQAVETAPEPLIQPEAEGQHEQQYWPGQQQQQWTEQPTDYYGGVVQSAEPGHKEQKAEDFPQPQISLPNAVKEEASSEKKEVVKPKAEAPPDKGGNGWFGGIFNKLTLKPKNQMKLPDDKNPTIVWDPEKKRWVNTDNDNDPASEFKPPPKLADLPSKAPVQENGSVPSIPSQPNMYKLQKTRNLKKSYIDVFNPNAKPGAVAAPAQMGGASANPPMNFFVPQPINDPNAPTDFLTPAPPLIEDNAQMAPQ